MRRKIRFSTMALAMLVSMPVAALDLAQTYELAVQHDPEFRAARAQKMADVEVKSQAMGALLPQINAGASKSKTSSDTTISTGTSSNSYDSQGYTLSLSQVIYNQDKFSGLSQASSLEAQAQANFRYAQQALILRVAERYFDVLGAQDNLEFTRAEKKAIAQQLEQTKQRFNVGLTAITDVHEAQARYDQSVAQDIAAENQLAVSQETLREIIGQPGNSLYTLSETSPLIQPTPANIDQWVKTALSNNLQLLAASHAREAASSAITRARSGHLPTLSLEAQHSYTDTDYNFSLQGPYEQEANEISLQLSMPLFSGGATSSQVREAFYRHEQAKENYEKTRRATERQARSSYLSVLANISQVKALKQALASSETALRATQAGLKVGTRTTVDVLDSQRELYRAKRDYALARYEYILESLRLKQAAGILNEADVKHVNRFMVMPTTTTSSLEGKL